MAASAAQAIIRRISTAGLAMSGISETASTTARAAALTTTDSHGRWKSAVQMIGLSRMIMIPEYVPPAAWASGSTDAVYSSGTVTSHQAGSRSQGTSTTSAAVTSRITTLVIASGMEAGPGGSARLASARMASAANGAIRVSRPSRRSAGPEVAGQRVRGVSGAGQRVRRRSAASASAVGGLGGVRQRLRGLWGAGQRIRVSRRHGQRIRWAGIGGAVTDLVFHRSSASRRHDDASPELALDTGHMSRSRLQPRVPSTGAHTVGQLR